MYVSFFLLWTVEYLIFSIAGEDIQLFPFSYFRFENAYDNHSNNYGNNYGNVWAVYGETVFEQYF